MVQQFRRGSIRHGGLSLKLMKLTPSFTWHKEAGEYTCNVSAYYAQVMQTYLEELGVTTHIKHTATDTTLCFSEKNKAQVVEANRQSRDGTLPALTADELRSRLRGIALQQRKQAAARSSSEAEEAPAPSVETATPEQEATRPPSARYDAPLSAEQVAEGLHQYAKPRRGWHVETQPALRGEIVLLEPKGHKAAVALQANYHFPTRVEQVHSDNYVVADREAAESFVRRRIAKSLAEHGELPSFLNRAARRADNREARRQGWDR